MCTGVVALFPPIRDMLGGIPVGTEAIRIAVGFGWVSSLSFWVATCCRGASEARGPLRGRAPPPVPGPAHGVGQPRPLSPVPPTEWESPAH